MTDATPTQPLRSRGPNPFTRLEAVEVVLRRLALLDAIAATAPAQLDGMAVARALGSVRASLRIALYADLDAIAQLLAEQDVAWGKEWVLELYAGDRWDYGARIVEAWWLEYRDASIAVARAKAAGTLPDLIGSWADEAARNHQHGRLAALDDGAGSSAELDQSDRHGADSTGGDRCLTTTGSATSSYTGAWRPPRTS